MVAWNKHSLHWDHYFENIAALWMDQVYRGKSILVGLQLAADETNRSFRVSPKDAPCTGLVRMQ